MTEYLTLAVTFGGVLVLMATVPRMIAKGFRQIQSRLDTMERRIADIEYQTRWLRSKPPEPQARALGTKPPK